jgi:hypothetical protein
MQLVEIAAWHEDERADQEDHGKGIGNAVAHDLAPVSRVLEKTMPLTKTMRPSPAGVE